MNVTSKIILCVDDDPTVLVALRGLLNEFLKVGDLVEIAESGQEALEICEELKLTGREVNVVISDFAMPGMQGDEFLIKLHAISPDTIKIMLTGQSSLLGLRRTINEANLFRFVEKPFKSTDFAITAKLALEFYEAEREPERRNEALERVVNQRTADLTETIERLKQTQAELVQAAKLASLGALVAGVAHELNTPIGNALTMASALEDSAASMEALIETDKVRRSDIATYAKRSKGMAEIVTRSCQRAADLITSFKQIAVDQTTENRRLFSLQTLVNDTIEVLQPGFKQTPWEIRADVSAEIMCDSYPVPLGQIITGLVQNAVTHAFEGRETGLLSITARQDASAVEMIFADNGVGMTPGVLARIFEPFFTTRLGQGGSGLGLSISLNIVTGVLGGSLTAASEPGIGSRFTLRIPLIAHSQTPSVRNGRRRDDGK